MHTYIHLLVLVLPQPQCVPHLGGEPADGNSIGVSVGSRDTTFISPAAWPTRCNRGTHLLAFKTHRTDERSKCGMAMSDTIMISILHGLLAITFPNSTFSNFYIGG